MSLGDLYPCPDLVEGVLTRKEVAEVMDIGEQRSNGAITFLTVITLI